MMPYRGRHDARGIRAVGLSGASDGHRAKATGELDALTGRLYSESSDTERIVLVTEKDEAAEGGRTGSSAALSWARWLKRVVGIEMESC
jgi:hypothetical protein